ncbi:MAG: VOC family protein [Iamia sp.]
MPEVTNHVHGTPSWTDLASPDPAASQEFYGALFGWDFEENPTDGGGTYVMCTKGGKSAAGMMQLSEQMAAAGMPPVWSTYVTVDDIEATAAKVEPAGGRVMQPPMDVMDNGRMAVLADSTGAMICLWEKKETIGAEVVNEHGALTWNELMSKDPGKAADFYAEVLAWTTQIMPMPDGDYTVFFTPGGDENGIAGGMKSPVEGMPSFWGVYFAVDDCDATVAAATDAGATVMAEAMSVPDVGRFAAIADPQGAMFSVMTPEG